MPVLTAPRIALLIGILFSCIRITGCTPLALLDTRSVDFRLMYRGAEAPSSQVAIVAIDDASIEAHGRWPWSRALVADLLGRIDAMDPAVIGFDIVQSEASSAPTLAGLPSRVPGVDAVTWARIRDALEQDGGDDQALAEAVAASGRTVVGYFFDFAEGAAAGDIISVSGYDIVQNRGEASHGSAEARKAVGNLAAIRTAARANGFFNTVPDPGDGVYRRVPLVVPYADTMALPLGLAMLRVYRENEASLIRFNEYGVESVRLGTQKIPVREDGQLLLNYRSPAGAFTQVSAADVLAGTVSPDTLRGRLVLVGVTAVAVADVRPSPLDGKLPGVEMHATLLDNVLRNDFIEQPQSAVETEVAAMLVALLILGLALQRARGVAAALVALALLAGYLAISQRVFIDNGLALGMAYPVLALVSAYALISIHQYVTEEREKRRIGAAFSLYLNPELAGRVAREPDLLRLGGAKAELTVLFSDIRGFTTISEGLDPQSLVELLNLYLGEMTDIVFDHSGTLDKYIGDAIMAVWGAPVPQEDHAAHACRAALAMMQRLRELQPQWEAAGWPRLDIGIGLHTGDMVVGNLGSARRLSYTVIGDNVNLGSRLEGLTKTYRAAIIISEDTFAATGDAFVARNLDLVRVKGKETPVRILELLATAEDAGELRALAARFDEGIEAYRARRWDQALAVFQELTERYADDGPSQLYVERCQTMAAASPGPDWDGVTTMTTK